jgi:hypothetical protein
MKTLILLPVFLASFCYAQTAAFDATSIKPNTTSSTGGAGPVRCG